MPERRWEELRNRGAVTARELRYQSTRAENTLWEILRGRQIEGLKFRRQHPVGGWVLDFACTEHSLAIEVDGPVHEIQLEDNLRRTESLQEMGYRVIRFTNDQVLTRPDFVIESILESIRLPPARSE